MKILLYLQLLRPIQWLKNIMLFFPPFLGGVLFMPGTLGRGVLPFASFCLASSSTYIFNDINDSDSDEHHPLKKVRPLASRKVSPVTASILGGLLLLFSLVLGYLVSGTFLVLLLAYLIISAAYSLKLKQIALIDLFCISSGFLLRLEAGGEAFGVIISEWLFLSVFLLALFLSTGKRLGEKTSLGDMAGVHRKALIAYPDGFLEGTLYMSGAAVLVTYTMYVISRHALVYTVILCCFGLLRFIFRIKAGQSGDPTDSLLKDGPLLMVGILWTVMVAWIIYG